MANPTEDGLTAEQLFAYPGHERYELVRGALRVSEPPGGLHGHLAARLAHLLHGYVETRGLGTVLVEAGFVVRRRPDTVRGPDVSFVSRTRLAPDQIPEAFIPFAPDLAVEILSPDDRAADIEEKVGDYIGGGTRVVWVVDSGRRSVTVHRADRAPEVKRGLDRLDGEDVVPGFGCSVAELFASRAGSPQGSSA